MTDLVIQPLEKTEFNTYAKKDVTNLDVTFERVLCCGGPGGLLLCIAAHISSRSSSSQWIVWGYEEETSDDGYGSSNELLIQSPQYCYSCGARHNVTLLPPKKTKRVIEKERQKIKKMIAQEIEVEEDVVVRDEWVEY